jgi:hypothetical protein
MKVHYFYFALFLANNNKKKYIFPWSKVILSNANNPFNRSHNNQIKYFIFGLNLLKRVSLIPLDIQNGLFESPRFFERPFEVGARPKLEVMSVNIGNVRRQQHLQKYLFQSTVISVVECDLEGIH